jgi:uncharacterized membrane protein YbhN (UPF0104 family)
MVRWRNIIGFVGSLAAVAIALLLLDWPALVRATTALSTGALLGAAVFSALSTFSTALRWAILTARPGNRWAAADFLNALVANAFNIFTPGALGADVYRVAIATGHVGARSRATGLVLAERLLGVMCLSLAFLGAYVVARVHADATPVFTAAAATILLAAALPAAALAVMLALRNVGPMRGERRVLGWIMQALTAVASVPKRQVFWAALFSACATATWLMCVAVVAFGAGLALPLEGIVMITVATEFARLLPISVQGIGVREATFAWLAVQAGGSAEPAFVACAIAYALHFALIAVFALGARAFGQWRTSINRMVW